MWRRVAAALVLCLASGAASGSAEPSATTCFGSPATIIVTSDTPTNGTDGPDVIVALDDGQHFIYGNGGDDKICGGAGPDSIQGGPGNDQIDGGPGGPDVAFYLDAAGPVHADLTTGVATGEGNDTLVSIDSLVGGNFDDTLIGDANINALFGLDGNDTLDGGPNWDVMMGGSGNDTLIGNPGDGDGAAFLLSDHGVTADLQSGTATGEGNDTLRGLDMLIGSKGDDTLRGDNRTNFLLGLGGNDVLEGRRGDDLLFGEDTSGGNPTFGSPGSDRLDGGPGNDTLFGGAGALIGDTFVGGAGPDDTVSYADAPNGITVDLAWGRVSGEGPDRISGVEDVTGSAWADRIIGDAKANALAGGDGSDTLSGGSGDDFLGGGNGTDSASGGPGRDYCLSDESTSGCEIGGLPPIVGSPGTPPVTPVARVIAAFEAMTGHATVLGPAVGAAPTVRNTAGYEYSAEPVCIAGTRGGTTQIAPPRIVDPVGTDGAAEEAWWRGTLVRGNPKAGAVGRVQTRTGWARAQLAGASLIPGGVVVWKDATGRRPFASPVGFRVGKGRYYWIGLIYWVRSGGKVFAPVEPHIIRARTVRHDKSCTFG
jgi:hypothetical protein